MADVTEINAKLDEVVEMLVESGAAGNQAAAEAMVAAARPNTTTVVGNLADIQRRGAVAAGTQDDPANRAAFETDGELVTEDVVVPPAQPGEDPMNRASGTVRGSGSVTNEQIAQRAGRSGDPATSTPLRVSDMENMTKAELEAEADRRGVEVNSSMTKAEMIEALGG